MRIRIMMNLAMSFKIMLAIIVLIIIARYFIKEIKSEKAKLKVDRTKSTNYKYFKKLNKKLGKGEGTLETRKGK